MARKKPIEHRAVVVAVDELKVHPRNYREHPEDQLAHLGESIKRHGFYRNAVIARDGTILAGHGTVEAAKKLGMKRIPVVRLDVAPDSKAALKVLTGDNQIAQLAESDDRQLSELLKEISSDTTGLLGTGFDERMLANLVYATRPESEIDSLDAAAAWANAGMPLHDSDPNGEKAAARVVMNFKTIADRDRFVKVVLKLKPSKITNGVQSIWWPHKPLNDRKAKRFQAS